MLFHSIIIASVFSAVATKENLRSHGAHASNSHSQMGNLMADKVKQLKKNAKVKVPMNIKEAMKEGRAKIAAGAKEEEVFSSKPKREIQTRDHFEGAYYVGYSMTRYRLLSDCGGPVEEVQGRSLTCENFFDDNGFPVSREANCQHFFDDEEVTIENFYYYEHDCIGRSYSSDEMTMEDCEYRVARTCSSKPDAPLIEDGVLAMMFPDMNSCYEMFNYYNDDEEPRRALKAGNKKTSIPTGKGRKSAMEKKIQKKNKKVANKDHDVEEMMVPQPSYFEVYKTNTCGHDSEYNIYSRRFCNPETNEVVFEVYADAACKDYVSRSVRTMEDVFESPIDECFYSEDGVMFIFCNTD